MERFAEKARSAPDPAVRMYSRMALSKMSRGGGNGDEIRMGILNIMRDNGIKEGNRGVRSAAGVLEICQHTVALHLHDQDCSGSAAVSTDARICSISFFCTRSVILVAKQPQMGDCDVQYALMWQP